MLRKMQNEPRRIEKERKKSGRGKKKKCQEIVDMGMGSLRRARQWEGETGNGQG